MLRVLFMGTPKIASDCLRILYEKSNADIIGVVTQPDKPKGRGMKMIPPEVKVFAEEHSISVYQPSTLKDGSFENILKMLDPDVIYVVAYGKILPGYVLSYPKYGCINVHASLLPHLRGAAPIQRAIMNGDRESGITIMHMDEGLDTGNIIFSKKIPIEPDDNSQTLSDKLALAGGAALVKVSDMLEKGLPLPSVPQGGGADYAEKITKEECLLDFNSDAESLCCRIRALAPAPGAYTFTPSGKMLKIIAATPNTFGKERHAPHGEVMSVSGGRIEVSCSGGSIFISVVIPEGKKQMTAKDFLNGRGVSPGDILGKTNG